MRIETETENNKTSILGNQKRSKNEKKNRTAIWSMLREKCCLFL